MKTILTIAVIAQSFICYLLIGFAVSALLAKINGYESWKDAYWEDDEEFLTRIFFWPVVAVVLLVLLPVYLVSSVLDKIAEESDDE